MSAEPLTASTPAAADGSERGLMLVVLAMVVLGAAAMLAIV
jgi:hypothetical protein